MRRYPSAVRTAKPGDAEVRHLFGVEHVPRFLEEPHAATSETVLLGMEVGQDVECIHVIESR